jgi:hypothetical protein
MMVHLRIAAKSDSTYLEGRASDLSRAVVRSAAAEETPTTPSSRASPGVFAYVSPHRCSVDVPFVTAAWMALTSASIQVWKS